MHGKEHVKTIKSVLALFLAVALLHGFAVRVSADEVSAEASSEVVCETTGEYGQNVNCRASSEASARAVLTRDGVPLHQVVNTGVDANGVLLAMGTVTTGLVATIAKMRNRA